MAKKLSPFVLDIGNIEISFTYFYFLGHNIKFENDKKTNLSGEIDKGFLERKEWRDSPAAHNLRDKFIDEILIDHFHLDESKIFNLYKDIRFVEQEGGGMKKSPLSIMTLGKEYFFQSNAETSQDMTIRE